ncbi:MAG: TA system VapC family ribonuclease toxin [Pseudonocardiaceae bacterium]
MILPDVNVLVYAFRRESPRHERYSSWLSELVSGSEELALVESTLIGFLRIVTNPRIYADPAPTLEALAFVDSVRRARRRSWLAVTEAVWTSFVATATADRQVRGNLIPDAWLAALARSYGCRLATADRGFARFEHLDWFDPARD